MKELKELAIELLKRAQLPLTDNVRILAADLATVHYEPAIDRGYTDGTSTEQLFLSRLGGIGNLRRYLKCITPKGRP